jgi:hypothetical protein
MPARERDASPRIRFSTFVRGLETFFGREYQANGFDRGALRIIAGVVARIRKYRELQPVEVLSV